MTETVLVLPVLLVVVGLAPVVAHMFLDMLVARTEAHRDTFDKTTTFALMPDALMNNHVNSALSAQFGAVNPTTRKHAFAEFPPDYTQYAPNIDNIFDPPGGIGIPIGPWTIDIFGDGFPNATVEGWEYIRRPQVFGGQGEMHIMTYGAVIRSPWTKLGYPFVPTQDLFTEPKKMQDWYGDLELSDMSDIRTAYHLAE